MAVMPTPLPVPSDPHGALVLERLRGALGDRYRVDEQIARGGMATVYRAYDLRHERLVAIKVLPPDLATDLTAERFLFEIRTAAQLLHPHILGLIDSGDAGGLLYYIMPHVDGESLRDKLRRERRIPLAEAARIVREVASALSHAHAHGVVHRDIKPENVLLVEGTHAVVADFGLAFAILAASSEQKRTQSSHIVGTVGYMGPEQVASGATVDARADIYSLGCMFFEMLSGRPPFEGHSPYAVLAQHVSAKPPRVSFRGSAVPPAIETIVHRMMEKSPDDRFQTAAAFCEALDAALMVGRGRWAARLLYPLMPWRRRSRHRAALGVAGASVVSAAALVALLPGAAPLRERITATFNAPLDTTRVAIFPMRIADGVPPGLRPEQFLHEAFSRWTGVQPVDHLQLMDRVAPIPTHEMLDDDRAGVAEEVGAGRYVYGEVIARGDSLRVTAALHDVRTGLQLHHVIKMMGREGADAAPYQAMAEQLLFRGAAGAGGEEAAPGSASVPARQEFLRGLRALREWHLGAADSAFTSALAYDPEYAAADLWLAQARSRASDAADQWRAPAARAVAGSAALTERGQLLAAALRDMAAGDFPAACERYARLQRADAGDFEAAFGLAECIRRDHVVVSDQGSPSRFRFRASRHQASLRYRDAFALLMPTPRAYPGRAFDRIRSMLLTSTNQRVEGRRPPPDTTRFRAAPAWQGDSLVLVPYIRGHELQFPERVVSPTAVEAVLRQRETFRDIAAHWRSAFPDDVGLIETMAIALEHIGDATALDTLRLARRLASDDAQRTLLAAREARLQVKLSMPDDHDGLAAARSLADSLLAHVPPDAAPEVHGSLASLAILTGKPHAAASLAARGAPQSSGIPSRVTARAAALLAYAAVGAPVDSILAIESRVLTDIRGTIDPRRRLDALQELFAQAAFLAFPVRLASHADLVGVGNAVLDAQWHAGRREYDTARALLRGDHAHRAARRAADLSLDFSFASANTLYRSGSNGDALAWIDPVLEAVNMQPPEALRSVANAGALVRALELRAELASAQRDTVGARRWAGAAAVLWAGADRALEPRVRRMHALAGTTPTSPPRRAR